MNRFETVQHLDECIEDSGQVPLERSPSDLRASSVSKRPVKPPFNATATRADSESELNLQRIGVRICWSFSGRRNVMLGSNEHRSMLASFARHRTVVASNSRCHGSHASLLVRLPIRPLALA